VFAGNWCYLKIGWDGVGGLGDLMGWLAFYHRLTLMTFSLSRYYYVLLSYMHLFTNSRHRSFINSRWHDD
jgi:hypothetical protein